MKKIMLSSVLFLSLFAFSIMTCVFAETQNNVVTINYILEESNLIISFDSEVVDTEIGNGRVWITNIEEVQTKNPAFVAPQNKVFIGWQYKNSIINGGMVSSTSAYEAGNHFTQNEYYSLSENETDINLVPVWGYTVYVDAINGSDNNEGTSTSPVRTMGRAYEVLAKLDSQNPNANITGFSVVGDSTSGYSYGAEDKANLVTNFNGRIVVKNDISYKDEYEGRYEYITYGDLINSENYNSSAGTVTFNDGVSAKSFTNLKAATGYSENDPVKLSGSGATYKVMAKTASGSYHYMLKKVLNNYAYTLNGTTYYTYGRLAQYTENLRAHVGKGLMSPKNDGLVLITSNDGITNYGATFEFGDYTRYASGGDLIYRDIQVAFFHNSSLDKESQGYVCGYAANGNYIAIDEGVTTLKDSTHIYTSIYGGGHNYRYNSYNYSGAGGNNLGDAGTSALTNTRITVKSGTWYGGYNGSYGQKIGGDVATYGKRENNAAVINVYGGTYTLGIGMGNEGAYSINSYVYVYGGNTVTVHGSGLGSSGAMSGKGITNVLITGEDTKVSGTVYGGSTSGTHEGDINLVIKNGTIGNTIYGGSSTKSVTGNITITVVGGSMKSIVGGCTTGSVNGKVTVNVLGGKITGDIYTSGQGGTQEDNRQFYTGGTQDSTLNSQILNINDQRLNVLITGDNTVDSEAIIAAAKSINSSATQHHNDKQLTISGVNYYYPQLYSFNYATLLSGYTRSTYGNHGVTQYVINSKTSYLSLATVKGVELNITGGEITGNIFGGGKVSVVEGDVNINISNAKIIGNVYGGGDGSYEPTVNIYVPTGQNTVATQKFTWKGSDTFNIDEYDQMKNLPIDWSNKYVYSPAYDYMGGVNGNVTINLSKNTNITGNVYGGGNEGMVTGEIVLNVNNVSIGDSIYGGGNVGHVSKNTQIILNGVSLKNLYGGGYSGRVSGSTSIELTDSNITEVFGGGYSGNIDGNTSILINSGNYTNVFAGCDKAVVLGNTKINVGTDKEFIITISGILYGGGRGLDVDSDGDASDFTTVEGNAEVIITGLNTRVENYGSIKLGTVVGNVDVTFKDYWTGNTTNKYKVMNGIDRATNVYFDNAYVLLENKDENGNLVGIKDITNLYIPAGSGIKVSATGEILGDFHGGGTFYLDSEVCLNIRGNIYGESLIVLNPIIVEDVNLIKGSKNYPYMRIYGEDSSNGTALYSNDPKYAMLYATEASGANIYYIEADVLITESITNNIINIEDKHYTDDVSNWPTKDFYLANSGTFSTDCEINITFIDDGSIGNLYKNVTRKLALYTGDNLVKLPNGTNIIMIIEDKLYKYRVSSDIEEINLNLFENMENEAIKYSQVVDIKGNATVDSGNELKKTYVYDESFRFIVDFSNVPESELLEQGPYNLVLNYYDSNVKIETSTKAVNVIMIEAIRKYNLEYSLDREWYENDSIILVDMTMTAEYSNLFEQEESLKDLIAVISIKDENGKIVALPANMKFYVDGKEISHTNANAMFTIVNGLTQSKMEVTNELKIDLSQMTEETFLPEGKKVICIDYYIAKDGVFEENVGKYEIETEIKRFIQYSLVCAVKAENGNTNTNSLNINRNSDNSRTIQIKYIGDLVEPNVKVQLELKNGNNFYSTSNIKAEIKYDISNDTKEIEVFFDSKMPVGIYRVTFDLVDKYGVEKASEAIIFTCE